jgi:hypothetical protein
MTARLSRDLVTEPSKRSRKTIATEIARKLPAEMTSSFTKCRRITLGLSPSSKWQETAPRTIDFSSSSESA